MNRYFKKHDINTYILLLSAPVLLALYRYHGYPEFFTGYFPLYYAHELVDLYSRLWQFGVFFLLMFVIPLLVIRVVFKKPLNAFGFGAGDYRYGLKLVLITLPLLVVPLMFVASKMPDVRGEYPLAKILLTRHDLILWYELAYVALYYVTWEFFFRGFLLFGLQKRFGSMNAILIQTIPSCLIHIGKPEGEIIGSIFVGILFGYFALRARSFWYVFILHAAIGVLIDLFIIFF